MFNHTHIKRSLVTGMAIGVTASPAVAQADMFAAYGSGTPAAAPITAPARHLDARGQTDFNWVDAGIGAGGAIVLVSAGAAGAAAMRRRRVVRIA